MPIHFETKLFAIGNWTILHLPENASKQLSSRGIVMVSGTANDTPFQTVLEPDGKFGHWFKIDRNLQQTANIKAGDTAEIVLEPTKEWVEPEIPEDIAHALAANPRASDTWASITPMARWEWIRWIRSTNNAATRVRRIQVACSKLKSGMRRPCCFNASACTEPYVSKNWVLLDVENSKSKE